MKLRNKSIIIRNINAIGVKQYCNPVTPILPWHRIRWSRQVRNRDSFRCQVCGTKKGTIVHHIIFKVDYPELTLVENNGITLCKPCEDQAHGRELQLFIPKHLKVPSLKIIIRNRPRRNRLSRWLRRVVYFLKTNLSASRSS